MNASKQINPTTLLGRVASLFIGLAVLGTSPAAPAQLCCGDADPAFNPGYGANARVFTSVRQPDGKVVVGGEFTVYGGASYHNYLARLNTDGSVEYGFAPQVSGAVYGVALQGDGKIIAVGAFGFSGIARFHSNGYLDTSFTPPSLNYYPGVVEVQSDGKILIGGSFTIMDGLTHPYLARLNANGTPDHQFIPAPNGVVYTIKEHFSGILIGGYFTSVGGLARGRFARLQSASPSGAVDPNWPSGPGANNVVRSIDTDSLLNLLIGGDFTQVHNQNASYLARLNMNTGALEGTLPEGLDGPVHVVRSLGGEFLIGGKFSNVGPVSSRCFARILAGSQSLSLVTTCPVGGGFTGGNALGTSVDTISAPLAPGNTNAFAGGNFTNYDGHSWNRVARIVLTPPCQ